MPPISRVLAAWATPLIDWITAWVLAPSPSATLSLLASANSVWPPEVVTLAQGNSDTWTAVVGSPENAIVWAPCCGAATVLTVGDWAPAGLAVYAWLLAPLIWSMK